MNTPTPPTFGPVDDLGQAVAEYAQAQVDVHDLGGRKVNALQMLVQQHVSCMEFRALVEELALIYPDLEAALTARVVAKLRAATAELRAPKIERVPDQLTEKVALLNAAGAKLNGRKT